MDGNIGGALDILEQITVKAVIQPYCGGMENMTAIEINNYLKEKNIQNIIPTRNRKFVLGNLNLVVYSPLKKTYTDVRNYSLATFVSFNKINMLFSANANKRRNEELLAVHWPKIDLYKIPNYGKENKTGINLIQELAPQTAVSTADTLDKGVENALLKTETIVYYVTEENISFSSDGESIKCINGKEELNGK
jgi:beta-lactamase superfamily II metal-dependent hydrolase